MKYIKYVFLLMIMSIFVLSGCSADKPEVSIDCVEDSVTCSDGTPLVRDGDNDCAYPACSDGRQYIGGNPEECTLIKFMCAEDKKPFFDDQGCGCEPITGGKLQAYDCTDPRPKACTKEYIPVCGQVQVQCIRAPCPPIMQTFSNSCEACANSLTISYTKGKCDDSAAGGTVLAGTPEEQCVSIDGRWTGYDCEGISAEQCQEIGGQFNECASACRNNPDAEVCTLQCVQVCKI